MQAPWHGAGRSLRWASSRAKSQIDARFRGRPLSFCFHPEATVGKIRTILAGAFEELATRRAENNTFTGFSAKIRKNLAYVRIVGRAENANRPSFNIAGSFNPGEMTLGTIEKKIGKEYRTGYPIELLAHFGHFAFPFSEDWKSSLVEALHVSGFAQFRRIWVLGWEGVEFTTSGQDF